MNETEYNLKFNQAKTQEERDKLNAEFNAEIHKQVKYRKNKEKFIAMLPILISIIGTIASVGAFIVGLIQLFNR